jgi:hypothetical protein
LLALARAGTDRLVEAQRAAVKQADL